MYTLSAVSARESRGLVVVSTWTVVPAKAGVVFSVEEAAGLPEFPPEKMGADTRPRTEGITGGTGYALSIFTGPFCGLAGFSNGNFRIDTAFSIKMILSLQLGICLLSGRDLGWIHTATAEIYISHGRAVRMGSTPKLVCVLPDLVQVVDLIVITVYACHGKDLLGIGYSRRDSFPSPS